jgi:dTDP-4-dehydrorhamnose reductase
MKVLVAGAKGQLGTDCMAVFARNHSVSGLDLPELDICSRDSISRAIDRACPDVVVNCAAFTRVDDCETQREAARLVNAVGPGLLAAACRPASLIHVSTDYVFSGERPAGEGWSEADDTGPLCWYGATKLEGEQRVRAAGGRWTIVRTAWLFGGSGRNFLLTMLRLSLRNSGQPLRVVADQHGSPTWSHRLAEQIAVIAESGGCGVYHAAGEGMTTWYHLAGEFLKEMGVRHSIEPCGMKDYPLPARRPRNSAIDNRRLTAEGLNRMGHWRSHISGFAKAHRDTLLSAAGAHP